MRALIFFLCFLSFLALSGCDLAPPNRENEAAQKVDAAAQEPDDAAQDADDGQTELRDSIRTPINRAKNANDPNVQHDKDQAQAIEDQGG